MLTYEQNQAMFEKMMSTGANNSTIFMWIAIIAAIIWVAARIYEARANKKAKEAEVEIEKIAAYAKVFAAKEDEKDVLYGTILRQLLATQKGKPEELLGAMETLSKESHISSKDAAAKLVKEVNNMSVEDFQKMLFEEKEESN